MITVAIITNRSGEVLFFKKGMGMDTLFVIIPLVGWDFIVFHIIFIRVTSAASLRNIPGESPGFGMSSSLDAMSSMTVSAKSDFCISFF